MAFDKKFFAPASSAAADVPKMYMYKTDDNKAAMVASGYFNDAVDVGLKKQDFIRALGVASGTEVTVLIFVDDIVAGVVTTLSTTETLA